eukprot:gene12665-15897_t
MGSVSSCYKGRAAGRVRAAKAGSSSQIREPSPSSSSSSLSSTIDYGQTLSRTLSKSILEHASDEEIRRVLSSGLITPGDVASVRTELLDAFNIPPDVASTILDQAGHWTAVSAVSSESMKVTGCTRPYLTLQIPACCASGSVKALAVRCVAHDEGSSSYPENKGTYQYNIIAAQYHNSWTTFELTVRDADGQSVRTVQRFMSNMHANSDWQTHAVTLVPGDEVINAIASGGSIVLEASSEFSFWENNVRSAAIVLFYDKAG